MNHYPHHIGDFRSATRHLTTVERAFYRECLDEYYDTERPLPADDFGKLARRLLAVTDEEKAALKAVLDEFFTLADDGWRHVRCDKEIERYQGLIDVASRAGKASAEARRSKKKPRSTPVERPLSDRATNQNENHNQIHSIEPNGSIADPPDSPPVDNSPQPGSAKDQAWAIAFPMLIATGIPEPRARSTIAQLLRRCGDEAVLQAAQQAQLQKPVEPISWLQASAKAIATQQSPSSRAKPSRHHGIDRQDFTEGVTRDGRF